MGGWDSFPLANFLLAATRGDSSFLIDLGVMKRKKEERFLTSAVDPFTGVKGEEKVGLLRSEGRGRCVDQSEERKGVVGVTRAGRAARLRRRALQGVRRR